MILCTEEVSVVFTMKSFHMQSKPAELALLELPPSTGHHPSSSGTVGGACPGQSLGCAVLGCHQVCHLPLHGTHLVAHLVALPLEFALLLECLDLAAPSSDLTILATLELEAPLAAHCEGPLALLIPSSGGARYPQPQIPGPRGSADVVPFKTPNQGF
uniref:Uncharacterized protein n=1 Tax=Sphaerodactylus townsendi TaxID=933632 RepID=A0ACB8FSZ7_9SAUR